MRRLLVVTFLFFALYTFFWIHFFSVSSSNRKINFQNNFPVQKTQFGNSSQPKNVLASTSFSTSPKKESPPPESYFIKLLPRQQAFNLSCEFAAASSIIDFYTSDPTFSVKNEEGAEKKLISQIGISQNPNIGIRMGDILDGNFANLINNLSKRFGGADYYGVHAPPFIDLFAKYGLLAKPILGKSDVIYSIKQAISSGHLVMAWIKLGYNSAIDAELSYGLVPIIRGEHSVVINGYDKDSIFLMDPGSGIERKVSYVDLLGAAAPFSMPFLSIYPSSSKISPEDTYVSDNFVATPRSKFTISVQNGSREIGRGSVLSDILRDFGYKVFTLGNANSTDYEDVSIKMKKKVWDYKNLLKKDLSLSEFRIATISGDLSENSPTDALVIIGN